MRTKPLEASTDKQPSGLTVPTGVLGTGMYVPDSVVTNADLTVNLDTSEEWITQKTGIKERRFLEEGKTTSDMCVNAARQALENSGLASEDLDAIIVATFTFDQPLPSTALIVKEALMADFAIPIDLNQAACAGGVYGIWLGSHLLQNEQMKHILVIGAECLSRVTNPLDRTTRVFFGDAAGALVLGKTAANYGLLAWDINSALSYSVEIPAGGSSKPTNLSTVAESQQFLRMEGRTVWQEATQRLPRSIANAVERAGLRIDDIRHFLIHQANLNIVAEVMKVLGCPFDKAVVNVDRLGNTGAATVFTVLHEAMEQEDIRHGDHIVISAIGAGFLWGSLCLRHYDKANKEEQK